MIRAEEREAWRRLVATTPARLRPYAFALARNGAMSLDAARELLLAEDLAALRSLALVRRQVRFSADESPR
jgi:hypothetical protein